MFYGDELPGCNFNRLVDNTEASTYGKGFLADSSVEAVKNTDFRAPRGPCIDSPLHSDPWYCVYRRT